MSTQAKEDFDWKGFEDYLGAVRRMVPRSIETMTSNLRSFSRVYKLPLTEYSERDLISALSKGEKRLAPATMNMWRNVLKWWYCFLHDVAEIEDRKLLQLLKMAPKIPRRPLKREDMLQLEDILEMCRRAQSHKWAAIFALLWDLALRPGELCRLMYKDVKQDKNGWYLEFRRSKTAKLERHYLMTWLAFKFFMPYYRTHLGKGPLFTNKKGEAFYPDALKSNVYRYAKSMKRKLYPYLIRKSASTWWRRRKILSVEGVKHRMGHAPHSTTFERHYQMLYDDDYIEEVVSAQGREMESVAPYVQVFCISCKTVNPPDLKECFYCKAKLEKTDPDRGRVIESYELQEEIVKLEEEKKELEEKADRIDLLEKRLDEISKLIGVQEEVAEAVERIEEKGD